MLGSRVPSYNRMGGTRPFGGGIHCAPASHVPCMHGKQQKESPQRHEEHEATRLRTKRIVTLRVLRAFVANLLQGFARIPPSAWLDRPHNRRCEPRCAPLPVAAQTGPLSSDQVPCQSIRRRGAARSLRRCSESWRLSPISVPAKSPRVEIAITYQWLEMRLRFLT